MATLRALIADRQPDDEYDEKYLVVDVVLPSRAVQETLLISAPCAYHSELLSRFRGQFDGASLVPHGGGVIRIDERTRRIETYGRSGSFGKPDRDVVERILRATFPDYHLDVTVTDYVRG
jgi:predicted Rdx family selenoprotein